MPGSITPRRAEKERKDNPRTHTDTELRDWGGGVGGVKNTAAQVHSNHRPACNQHAHACLYGHTYPACTTTQAQCMQHAHRAPSFNLYSLTLIIVQSVNQQWLPIRVVVTSWLLSNVDRRWAWDGLARLGGGGVWSARWDRFRTRVLDHVGAGPGVGSQSAAKFHHTRL